MLDHHRPTSLSQCKGLMAYGMIVARSPSTAPHVAGACLRLDDLGQKYGGHAGFSFSAVDRCVIAVRLSSRPCPLSGAPSLVQPRPSTINPQGVRYASVRPLRLRLRGDRGRGLNTSRTCRAGMVPAQRRELQMSHNLNLAQDHAWHLARTLMVPVVLFQSEGAFGVMEASEYEGGEDAVVTEYDPWSSAR